MKIFQLTQYDFEGDSYSLWSHINKRDDEFKTDCDWILNTHFDLLLEPKVELTGEVWYENIGTDECLRLIEKYLPKLGYMPVKTVNYGFDWSPFKPAPKLYEVLLAENKVKSDTFYNNFT